MPLKGQKWTKEQRIRYMKSFQQRRDYHGQNNPKWKGGKIIRPDGRVMIYAPDRPSVSLYILEYRLIAEQKIGRHLYDNEVVHHIDGDVSNNDMDNLEIMTQAYHAKIHGNERSPINGRFV